MMAPLPIQISWLFLLAVPVACIAWTVTQEEVFREFNEYCKERSEQGRTVLKRKFFYLFTCQYCFSHYITLFFLLITKYTLLMPGWKGFLIAFFSVVWIANVYMSVYGWLRISLKKERTITKVEEQKIE